MVRKRLCEVRTSQPPFGQLAYRVVRRAHRPFPATILKLHAKGAVLRAPVAGAWRFDPSGREGTPEWIQPFRGQRPTESRRMIHQVAADLVARIRDALWAFGSTRL